MIVRAYALWVHGRCMAGFKFARVQCAINRSGVKGRQEVAGQALRGLRCVCGASQEVEGHLRWHAEVHKLPLPRQARAQNCAQNYTSPTQIYTSA